MHAETDRLWNTPTYFVAVASVLFVYVCFKWKLKTNHKTNYKLYCIGYEQTHRHTHTLKITSQTMNMNVYVVVVYKGAREDPSTG